MKKFLCAMMFVLMAVSCAWAEYYDDADGTEGDPYLIKTIADLEKMRDRVNDGTEEAGKFYKLTNDLNISQVTDWKHIGTDKYPFYGHFSGDNHSIHLNINQYQLGYP